MVIVNSGVLVEEWGGYTVMVLIYFRASCFAWFSALIILFLAVSASLATFCI